MQCIDTYWDDVSFIPSDKLRSKLSLDAEQMILICMYVAMQSQLPDFFAELKLAYQFATASVRHTKLGYCLTTLEMSLDQILNMTDDDLLPAGQACDVTPVNFKLDRKSVVAEMQNVKDLPLDQCQEGTELQLVKRTD